MPTANISPVSQNEDVGVVVMLDVRRAITKLWLDVLEPQIAWLGEVRVGRDQIEWPLCRCTHQANTPCQKCALEE